MNLFNSIDAVVKSRGTTFEDVNNLLFYEFNYILENMEKERKEQEKANETESDGQVNNKYKPIDTNAIMKNSMDTVKNFKPKY